MFYLLAYSRAYSARSLASQTAIPVDYTLQRKAHFLRHTMCCAKILFINNGRFYEINDEFSDLTLMLMLFTFWSLILGNDLPTLSPFYTNDPVMPMQVIDK